jgi:hypothetical protein
MVAATRKWRSAAASRLTRWMPAVCLVLLVLKPAESPALLEPRGWGLGAEGEMCRDSVHKVDAALGAGPHPSHQDFLVAGSLWRAIPIRSLAHQDGRTNLAFGIVVGWLNATINSV